jgi:hypothetical protein
VTGMACLRKLPAASKRKMAYVREVKL